MTFAAEDPQPRHPRVRRPPPETPPRLDLKSLLTATGLLVTFGAGALLSTFLFSGPQPPTRIGSPADPRASVAVPVQSVQVPPPNRALPPVPSAIPPEPPIPTAEAPTAEAPPSVAASAPPPPVPVEPPLPPVASAPPPPAQAPLPPIPAAEPPAPPPRAEPRPDEPPAMAAVPPPVALPMPKPVAATPMPKPTAPPPLSPPTVPVPAQGRFSIQVGSFQSADNAEVLVRSLTGRGLEAFSMDWTDGKGVVWRVVRVGRYETIEEAKRAATAMQAAANLHGTVVRLR